MKAKRIVDLWWECFSWRYGWQSDLAARVLRLGVHVRNRRFGLS